MGWLLYVPVGLACIGVVEWMRLAISIETRKEKGEGDSALEARSRIDERAGSAPRFSMRIRAELPRILEVPEA